MASVLREFRRRKVFQVAVVYAVVAWVLIQIVATVETPLSLPPWFDTAVIVLLLVGFPIAMILAWIYDFSGGSLQRTPKSESNPSAATASSDPAAQSERTAAGTPPLPNSIAVLPFENMSPDPERAYFAAGIHEEILNSLAKLKSLHVIARTSVLQYAGARRPIAEIAMALGVETIMEGSVRYAGKRVRVTTQLIDARTGGHLWSEVYEREIDDIFAIQSDIALNVADAMRAELSRDEKTSVEERATTSTDAYSFYLQTLSVDTSGGDASQMHALLDRAIEHDPNFGLALGAKAATYGAQLINTTAGEAGDETELGPLIHQFAERALARDPKDSNAHTALCILAEYTWHWAEARVHAMQALENPRWGVLVATANWTFSWAGETEHAIELARHLQRLSPTDWSTHWNLGVVLNYAGQYDEAAEAFRRAIVTAAVLPVIHSWLAVTEVARGETASAIAEIELTEKLLGERRPVIFLVDLAYAYGRLGDAVNAGRLFDEILSRISGHELGAGSMALAHLAIGEHDKARKFLRLGADKAARHEIDAGMYSLMNLKCNFTSDPVLEEPAFVEIREALRGD